MPLSGKIALVTGAARGIGFAIAKAFAGEGALVWLGDIRDHEGARAAERQGPGAACRHLDVREEIDWAKVVDEVLTADGRLDAVVNDAGITGWVSCCGRQWPWEPSYPSMITTFPVACAARRDFACAYSGEFQQASAVS